MFLFIELLEDRKSTGHRIKKAVGCDIQSVRWMNSGLFSRLRSGSVCRAVLAAEGGGGASAGPGGKGRPAAQHRSWWSSGGHSLQDGLPSRNKVCSKLTRLLTSIEYMAQV